MADNTLTPEQIHTHIFRPLTAIYRRTTYPAIDPSRPELSTKGKTAIITGAGQGIGASIAKSLAKSGVSTLALIGRTEKKLQATKSDIEKISPDTAVYLYTLDVVDLEAVSSAFNSFVSTTGSKIDILIANAGYMADLGTIANSDPAEWWKGFEINIKGGFNTLRSYAPHAAPNGTVIHISTAAAHMMYMPDYSSYRASKMGAHKMFEIFGHEMKDLKNGVRTVQVHPGLIKTGLAEKIKNSKVDVNMYYDDAELSGDFTNWCLSEEAKFLDGKFVWANWDVEELIKNKEKIEADEKLYTFGLIGW